MNHWFTGTVCNFQFHVSEHGDWVRPWWNGNGINAEQNNKQDIWWCRYEHYTIKNCDCSKWFQEDLSVYKKWPDVNY